LHIPLFIKILLYLIIRLSFVYNPSMIERIKRNPEQKKTAFEGRMRQSLQDHGLTEAVFTNSAERVITRAQELLETHHMDPHFGDDPEQMIFAVAIADKLEQQTDPQEREALDTVLKLVAVGPTDRYTYTTQSKIVETLANQGEPQALWLHPHYYDQTWHSTKARLEQPLLQNKDVRLTQQANQLANHWGPRSLLHHVRQQQTISQFTEKPFTIIVSADTGAAFQQQVSAQAFYKPTTRTIVLPRDYTKQDLEHEYSHSQRIFQPFGYQGLLWDAIDEANTESMVTRPEVYSDQRFVLRILHRNIPHLRKDLQAATQDNTDARKTILMNIVMWYGFDGMLAIARMQAHEDENSIEKKVTIPPLEVAELLGKKDRISYLSNQR
jgi:hypothetical protein